MLNDPDVFKTSFFDFPEKPAYAGPVNFYAEVIFSGVGGGNFSGGNAHAEAYFNAHRPIVTEGVFIVQKRRAEGNTIAIRKGFV
jgi:hypothetical protein